MRNQLSELSLLCINNDKKLPLYLWDPVFCQKKAISIDLLNNLDSLVNYMEDLVNNIKTTSHEDYQHWIQRGWHKSLDYYCASRHSENILDKSDPAPSEKNMNRQRKLTNDIHQSNHTENERISVIDALLSRHTVRNFTNQSMDNTSLSKLLFNNSLAPNELFGFDIYLCVYNVKDLMPGVYRVDSQTKLINSIKSGNFRETICHAIQGMEAPRTANISIFIVGKLELLPSRFPGYKGLRDVYVETGKIAQKFIVKLTQLGLFCLETPAINDDAICTLLDLNQLSQYPLYSLTVGYEIQKGESC